MSITVEIIVHANIQKTWDYLTKPEHITQWNHASDDWRCPRATNDLRVGGLFSSRMEAKDGSVGFDFEGVYSEVVPSERYTYAIAHGRNVETILTSEGEDTKVTTIFDTETENSEEMQRNGWQAILNNFKTYVERH